MVKNKTKEVLVKNKTEEILIKKDGSPRDDPGEYKKDHILTVLTQEQKDVIGEFAWGMTQEEIARYLKISPETFRQIRLRDPKIDDLYLEGKAKLQGETLRLLVSLANGTNKNANLGALCFMLKTKFGFSEVPKFEVAPVAILTPEQQLQKEKDMADHIADEIEFAEWKSKHKVKNAVLYR